MKEKERAMLNRLNRFFISDILIEDSYEYNRFDAENKSYILELKYRHKHYNDTIIEFDKFSYNLLYANELNKWFIYAVQMGGRIYVYNITKMYYEDNYNFDWEFRKLPKQTEFSNNQDVYKYVGYLPISKAVNSFSL
tara:strand:+ start:855 stop:1265 length:411 start_codon:yes stop_codon:yes gene_type:complete